MPTSTPRLEIAMWSIRPASLVFAKSSEPYKPCRQDLQLPPGISQQKPTEATVERSLNLPIGAKFLAIGDGIASPLSLGPECWQSTLGLRGPATTEIDSL